MKWIRSSPARYDVHGKAGTASPLPLDLSLAEHIEGQPEVEPATKSDSYLPSSGY